MTVTLIQAEAMVWWIDPEIAVAHGDTHTVVGAKDCTLTAADGLWTATCLRRMMEVKLGTDGGSVGLLADGADGQSSNGATSWRPNGRNPCAHGAGGGSWYCKTRGSSGQIAHLRQGQAPS